MTLTLELPHPGHRGKVANGDFTDISAWIDAAHLPIRPETPNPRVPKAR